MDAVFINYDISKYDEDTDNTYYLTDFICDDTDDVTAANAEGSDYLNYPSGSSILCLEDKKVYVLKADNSAYVEVG